MSICDASWIKYDLPMSALMQAVKTVFPDVKFSIEREDEDDVDCHNYVYILSADGLHVQAYNEYEVAQKAYGCVLSIARNAVVAQHEIMKG